MEEFLAFIKSKIEDGSFVGASVSDGIIYTVDYFELVPHAALTSPTGTPIMIREGRKQVFTL